jgi:GTP-binding protein HflX
MKNLRSYIIEYFLKKQNHYDLFVPYEDGLAHSAIVSKTNIISSQNHEKGIFYRVRVPDFMFGNLGVGQYILAPNDPIYETPEWTTF